MTFEGRRVLIVEDEFLAALTTTDFLESMGCEVVGPASRLPAALQLARSELLDAAVLDINLAGVMAWPVAELLQARKVPFLFLSAYSCSNNMVPLAFATTPCLAKPLEPYRLLQQFNAMWGQPLHSVCSQPVMSA